MEIEELKCLARQSPSHSSHAAQAEPRTEAQSDKDVRYRDTAPPAHTEGSRQDVQAMGILEDTAADAAAEAPEGSAGPHAAAQAHQPQPPNSATGAQFVELPSASVSESDAPAIAPMRQALHVIHCNAVALGEAPEETLGIGAPTMITRQTALLLAKPGSHYSAGNASPPVADCSKDTHAVAVQAQELAHDMDWEAPVEEPDPVATMHMQGDCQEFDILAGEDSCGQELASAPEADAASRGKGPRSQRSQAAEDRAAQPPAADVHCSSGDLVQAAADVHGSGGDRVQAAADVHGSSDDYVQAAADVHGSGGNRVQAAADVHGSGGEPVQAAADVHGPGGTPDQAAADVHGPGDSPVQAAAEMQAKLGTVVELVSAVCGSFSPHDAAGALLHNLQVLFVPLFTINMLR